MDTEKRVEELEKAVRYWRRWVLVSLAVCAITLAAVASAISYEHQTRLGFNNLLRDFKINVRTFWTTEGD